MMRQRKKYAGFTLIELLLVISIIGVLAGIVVAAVNPSEQLRAARGASASVKLQAMEKGFSTHIIESSNVQTDAVPLDEANAISLCSYGIHQNNCLNVDYLYTENIVKAGGVTERIPLHPDLDSGTITGFRAYRTPSGLIKVLTGATTTTTKIYYKDPAALEIRRVDPDGSNMETISSLAASGRKFAADLLNNRIVWSDNTGGFGSYSIKYADYDGSSTTTVPSTTPLSGNSNSAFILALNPETNRIYYNSSGSPNNFNYYVQYDGSTNTFLGLTNAFLGRPFAFDSQNNAIFYIVSGIGSYGINRTDINGGSFASLTGSTTVQFNAVDLDRTHQKLYYSQNNAGTYTIKRMNYDGTNDETLLTTPSQVSYMFVDVAHDYLYYVVSAAGSIYRADLDGSDASAIVTGLSTPLEIKVDYDNRKIMWQEGGGATKSIRRADLDGSNVETIITSATEFIIVSDSDL